MIFVSTIPRRVWFRLTVPGLVSNFFLLLLVLVPGIGRSAYGGRRWIGTGSFHLQPSEIAIITTAMYLAYFFTRKAHVLERFKVGLRPALIVVILAFGLIFAEPDMGTSLTLLGTSLAIIFASGARMKHLLVLLGAAVPAMLILALSASYRSSRIQAFVHPFTNAQGSAYQLIQGWTGIAAGGWFGRGFGMSIEKTGYLPFPYTDFIFAVFTEECGFIGAIVLIGLFAIMVWRGLWIARHAATRFEYLLAVGLTCMIAVATFINLGAVTGVLPVTGIPLPFISYGGTSIIVYLGAVGMLLGISRSTLDVEPEADMFADIVDLNTIRSVQHQGRQSRHELTATKPTGTVRGKHVSQTDEKPMTWREKNGQSKTSAPKRSRRTHKRSE